MQCQVGLEVSQTTLWSRLSLKNNLFNLPYVIVSSRWTDRLVQLRPMADLQSASCESILLSKVILGLAKTRAISVSKRETIGTENLSSHALHNCKHVTKCRCSFPQWISCCGDAKEVRDEVYFVLRTKHTNLHFE